MANMAFKDNTAALQPDTTHFSLEIFEDSKKAAENTVDGIEILVEMAKSGKIDPWNIDIADVTEKYMQKLVEIKSYNLKLTGRAIFFAALLLRLKSDVLEGISLDGNQEFSESDFLDEIDNAFDDDIENINMNNVISLDEVLERRTSVRLNRERIVTLDDLIKQLEFYEKIDKRLALQNKNNRALRRAKSYEKFTAEDIINLAHDEYIENSVKVLESILERIFITDSRVELSELKGTGMDKVSIYIALLFLSARSDIDLVQDEFYSDLYVVPANNEPNSEKEQEIKSNSEMTLVTKNSPLSRTPKKDLKASILPSQTNNPVEAD